MARTLLTKTSAPGGYAAAGVAVTLTAADTTNKNMIVAEGADLIIARNSGASPYTVTITSSPDAFGRTKDITTESIAAGEVRVFGPYPLTGWVQSDGRIYLEASNAAVLLGAIKLS